MAEFVASLKKRFFSNVAGDLTGGLTAAIVALPIALAFGVASGLGAAAGLYGAIACGIVAALFGGTAGQVSGPTGPMTLVAATIIGAHVGRPELVFAAVIVGGLLQVALGLLKAGRMVRYIPYPVVSGFMTGIGVIIVCLQLNPLFGVAGTGNVLEAVRAIPELLSAMDPTALAIGVGTLAVIYLLPRLTRRVPAALAALVLATIASVWLDLDVARIGAIPAGLPLPSLPAIGFTDLKVVLTAGIYLALLGSLDSLLTSVVVDRITGTRHNSDQELVGQGLGNAVAGLLGGLPGAGATMRSVVNIRSGGRSYLSGVVHGFILLAVLLGLGTLAAYIPLSCLAAILIAVGVDIIDYRGLKSVFRAPRADVVVMLAVLALTIFADLIIAVGAGFVLACILFVRKLGESRLSEHGHLASIKRFEDLARRLPEAARSSVYLYTFNGPFFFGEVENFRESMERLDGVRFVIVSMSGAPVVDQTGAYALQDVAQQLATKGVAVCLVGLQPDARLTLDRLGVLAHLDGRFATATLEEAVDRIAASFNA